MPFVSVVMNCHNCASFLREALQSVLDQTYTDYEIVVWDNCSVDNSAEICRSFSDSRLRYFKAAQFAPLGEARNLCMSKARGEWLAFLDCDDVWTRTKLEQQMEVGMPSNVGLVYGYTETLIEEVAENTDYARRAGFQPTLHTGYQKGALPSGNIYLDLIRNSFIPLSSLCVRRSAFESVGGFNRDLKYAEDYDLLLRIASVTQADVVQELCCLYRIHASNVSHGVLYESIGENITVLSEHAVAGCRHSAAAREELRRQRTRLLLHQIRAGDRRKLFQLLWPSSWMPLARLLIRNAGLRVAYYAKRFSWRKIMR